MSKIREKIEIFEEKLNNLQEESSIEPTISIEFPQYKILPVEIKLALEILEKHECKFMLSYKEK